MPEQNPRKKIAIPKRAVSVVLILITLVAAVYYFYKHHNLLTTLAHVSPAVVIEVFGLYALMLGVIVLIFEATMRLVNVKLKYKENGYINAYSLFMNFFIPGQTGPAYRGYYMKKNHGLKYLSYTIATLIYYAVYGLLSLIFVVSGSQPYYLTLALIVICILVVTLAVKLYIKKFKQAHLNLSPNNVLFLIGTVLAQVLLQSVIYFVELHSVKSGIRLNQVVAYTGTANLALFVALTPGAIGIREGFLILTEKLNHLSSSTIVLANVIDRSVYIVFLSLLGLAIAILKIRQYKLGSAKPTIDKD